MTRDMQSILRECLSERGLSQKWLADKVGTTEATISRCLNGINIPGGDLIMAISDALGVSMDYLMGRTPVASIDTRKDGEEYIIGRCFSRCTTRDRDLVMRILADYMTEEEQSYFNS